MPCVLKYGTDRIFEVGLQPVDTIGTSVACSIRLPADSGLSAEWARLRRTGGRWLLELLTPEPLSVDGVESGRYVWLTPGCVISFPGNPTRLTFTDVDTPPRAVTPAPSVREALPLQPGGQDQPRRQAAIESRPCPETSNSRAAGWRQLSRSPRVVVTAALLLLLTFSLRWIVRGAVTPVPAGDMTVVSADAGEDSSNTPAISPATAMSETAAVSTATVAPEPVATSAVPNAIINRSGEDRSGEVRSSAMSRPADVNEPAARPMLPVAPPAGGVVWIGLRLQTRRLLCTGWVVAPDQVVTAGGLAHVLVGLQDVNDAGLFVYSEAADSRVIDVRAAEAHPAWAADPPDPEFNLAVLTLAEPLPARCVCRLADPSALAAVSRRSELWACGYDIGISREEPPRLFDQLNPPELVRRVVTLQAATQIPGHTGAPTFRPGEETAQPGGDTAAGSDKSGALRSGWPVWNRQGQVIGMLSQVPDAPAIVIPVDRLSDLTLHQHGVRP